MLTARYTCWLAQSVYGGLRSFTTGRRNTWMTALVADGAAAGGHVAGAHHRLVAGSLTFTWARDGIDAQRSASRVGRDRLERHIEDESFLDGQVACLSARQGLTSAGASFGTRYDVQFDAA